jgi:hypothetical protein
MPNSPIECALSGVVPTAEELADAATFTEGPSGLPEDWTEIRVIRRRINPAWETIQEAKELTLRRLLMQVPKENREEVEPVVIVQIEAQFAALESRPEYATTILDEVVVYVAPSTAAEGLEEAIKSLAATLNIDPNLILAPLEDDDEEDVDDNEDEPSELVSVDPTELEAAG